MRLGGSSGFGGKRGREVSLLVGPRRRVLPSRWAGLDTILAVAVIAGGTFYLFRLLVGERNLDLGYVQEHGWAFLGAARFNLYITAVAFSLGMVIGFFVGWARTIKARPLEEVLRFQSMATKERESSRMSAGFVQAVVLLRLGAKHFGRRMADAYVEVIRGTPLFVQLIFAWFMLVLFYPNLDTLVAAIVGFTVNTGGYQGEIFRGGLQTVHSGQVEAAKGLGFSRLATMRHIILPQALRLIIPPLTNEFIGLFKVSVFVILLGETSDVLFLARALAFRGNVFEIFAMVTALFLLVTIPLSRGVQYLERRFRIPGLGIQHARSDRE